MDSLMADVDVESRVVDGLYKAEKNYITLFCLKITCCTKFVFILHNLINNLNDCYDIWITDIKIWQQINAFKMLIKWMSLYSYAYRNTRKAKFLWRSTTNIGIYELVFQCYSQWKPKSVLLKLRPKVQNIAYWLTTGSFNDKTQRSFAFYWLEIHFYSSDWQ